MEKLNKKTWLYRKEILFHSMNANSVKHLIEALGYHFILPREELLIVRYVKLTVSSEISQS